MNKITRFLSIELVLTLLILLAFSLPWLDMGFVLKMNGWQIPELKTKITKVANFFSSNKSFLYTTHAVYIIPILSIGATLFAAYAKPKTGRMVMAIACIFASIISIMLKLQLPKAGTGVYLLGAVGLIGLAYVALAFYFGKKKEVAIDNDTE